jgi:hypothetical protein
LRIAPDLDERTASALPEQRDREKLAAGLRHFHNCVDATPGGPLAPAGAPAYFLAVHIPLRYANKAGSAVLQ